MNSSRVSVDLTASRHRFPSSSLGSRQKSRTSSPGILNRRHLCADQTASRRCSSSSGIDIRQQSRTSSSEILNGSLLCAEQTTSRRCYPSSSVDSYQRSRISSPEIPFSSLLCADRTASRHCSPSSSLDSRQQSRTSSPEIPDGSLLRAEQTTSCRCSSSSGLGSRHRSRPRDPFQQQTEETVIRMSMGTIKIIIIIKLDIPIALSFHKAFITYKYNIHNEKGKRVPHKLILIILSYQKSEVIHEIFLLLLNYEVRKNTHFGYKLAQLLTTSWQFLTHLSISSAWKIYEIAKKNFQFFGKRPAQTVCCPREKYNEIITNTVWLSPRRNF